MSTTAAPPETKATGGKGGFLPILIGGLLSTVLGGGMVLGAGYWLLKSGKLAPVAAASGGKGAAAAPAEAAAVKDSKSELPPSKIVPLEPMVVNLSDAGGRAYLRASISLRMAEENGGKAEKAEGKPDAAAVAGKTAALRDTTLTVLGAETSDALLGNEGVAAVKKRLRERYALENPEVHVLDVYFTDFLVQRG